MQIDNNHQAFFALLRAGMWGMDVQLQPYSNVDFRKVYRLAEEQSVVGLVAAGIEHVSDLIIPKQDVMPFVGRSLQLEQRNLGMNKFINALMDRLHQAGIYAPLLVKGQGIAQCYERPLWRASGDIDLLLDADNYEKAKTLLIPIANKVETEYTGFKHLGMMIDGWVVELHGTLHSRLSNRIDQELDRIQEEVFKGGGVRIWKNEDKDVFLPEPDSDVLFLFSHILHHFFIEGIGLRQICDWCRFMWIYRDSLSVTLLEDRLNTMGILSEWRAFAAMTVYWLGMPVDTMPLFLGTNKWHHKANQIVSFILESGSFGQNRQVTPSGSKIIRNIQYRWSKIRNFVRHLRIFPWDSVRYFFHFFKSGIQVATQK